MFFFFKQKTAYEIEYGLVGSEMCIRDRDIPSLVNITRRMGRKHQNCNDRRKPRSIRN